MWGKVDHELPERAGLLVLIYIRENIRKVKCCAQRLSGDSCFPGVCSRTAVFDARSLELSGAGMTDDHEAGAGHLLGRPGLRARMDQTCGS